MSEFVAPVGPVDIAVIAFDEPTFDGRIAGAIAELQASGIVRLLDAIVVNKDADGTLTYLEITDIDGDGELDLIALQGDSPGMLSEDDAAAGAESMPPGSAILMLAWENTWAIRAAMAIRENGGTLVAHERIPPADVQAALEAMIAAEG
jgi:hypothetical protein